MERHEGKWLGTWWGWDLNPQGLHVNSMLCCFSWDDRGC